MKFFGVLSTVLVATSLASSVGFSDPTVSLQPTLQEAIAQVGVQKHIIYVERQAYKVAKANRDNSVHFGKDFFTEVGLAAGSGYFLMRAARKTDNFAKIRSYFGPKDVPSAALENAAEVEAKAPVGSARWALARDIGTTTLRATEVATGAVLIVIFAENLTPTLNEFVVSHKDTDEMKAADQKLAEAEKNLDIYEARLKDAAVAEAGTASGM
jgi:hypothetical protein